MPDDWENDNGLNPNDASDRNGTDLSSEGYTNLEVYLNYTVEQGPTAINNIQPVVAGFTLENNYPNPFNPTTTIKFSLDKGDDVSIKIYNVRGQLVRTLTNKYLTSGVYKVRFNGMDSHGRKLSSGIYFYALKNSKQSITKKMIMLK